MTGAGEWRWTTTVAWDELDAMGILHHARFLVHVERTCSALLEEMGYPYRQAWQVLRPDGLVAAEGSRTVVHVDGANRAEPWSEVFHGGRVLTMDPARPVASCLAVWQGRVLAVGDDEPNAVALMRVRFEVPSVLIGTASLSQFEPLATATRNPLGRAKV